MKRIATLALGVAVLLAGVLALDPMASSTTAAAPRRTPAATQTTTWTAHVSVSDTSIFAFKLARVPAGAYLGTLSGLVYTGATEMACAVTTSDGKRTLLADDTAPISGVHLVNGARTFTLGKRQTLLLICTTLGRESFDTEKRFPLQVSLTRLSELTGVTARPTTIKAARLAHPAGRFG
jgi:hypothetical protein